MHGIIGADLNCVFPVYLQHGLNQFQSTLRRFYLIPVVLLFEVSSINII